MEIQGDVGELCLIQIGYRKGKTMEMVGLWLIQEILPFLRDFCALSGGV